VTQEVEEFVAFTKLTSRGISIDKLTKDQEKGERGA